MMTFPTTEATGAREVLVTTDHVNGNVGKSVQYVIQTPLGGVDTPDFR